MTVENVGARERVSALEKQISGLELHIKLANESQVSLANKILKIESNSKKYPNKIKEIEQNEKTKDLLDTRLTDDLKRLLHEATHSE